MKKCRRSYRAVTKSPFPGPNMKVRHQKCGRGMGLGTRPASAILSAGSWQSGATAMARVPPPARVRVVAIGTDSNSNSRRASRRWSHAFRPSTPVPESALDVPVDAASPGDEHNEEKVDRVKYSSRRTTRSLGLGLGRRRARTRT
jgi:hypothetical protein